MRPALVVTRFISLHPGAQKCYGPFGSRCPDRAMGKTSLPTLNEQRNHAFQPEDAGKTNRFKPFHFLFFSRQSQVICQKAFRKNRYRPAIAQGGNRPRCQGANQNQPASPINHRLRQEASPSKGPRRGGRPRAAAAATPKAPMTRGLFRNNGSGTESFLPVKCLKNQ